MPSIEIFCNTALKKLSEYPDNFFDSVVTDPPYGLGKEPDAMEVLKDWIEKGYHEIKSKGGFMGKEWDSFVPQPILWKEVFRVLKPGGYLIFACSTRTQDWMAMSVRLAGFEIRDLIAWHYGQGFPKGKNISKAIDDFFGAIRRVTGKRKHPTLKDPAKIKESKSAVHATDDMWLREWNITEATTELAKKFKGFSTALKPATELWTIARKPLSEKTLAENIIKWGTGSLNIDGCRIKSVESWPDSGEQSGGMSKGIYGDGLQKSGRCESNNNGRWPANVILTHHPDCVCKGVKKIKGHNGYPNGPGGIYSKKYQDNSVIAKDWNKFSTRADDIPWKGYSDETGQETVEQWECVDGCPIKELDEQTGVLTSGKVNPDGFKGPYKGNVYGKFDNNNINPDNVYGDSGSASRFFYCAKASRSERNKGLELLNFKKSIGHNRFDKCKNCGGYILQNPERKSACLCENPTKEDNVVEGNYHPTVKPITLMRWLVRLVTPTTGKVLDCFNGSGTTGIACKLENFDYFGIEEQEDMCLISEYRIRAYESEYAIPENSLFDDL